jgi:hypothetical protein
MAGVRFSLEMWTKTKALSGQEVESRTKEQRIEILGGLENRSAARRMPEL